MRKLKLLLLPALLIGAGAFDREVVHCEEAYAHLQDCCPSLHADNVCGGAECAANIVLPAADSDCIARRECGPELDAVCVRVTELSQHAADYSTGKKRQPRVCP